MRDHNGHCMGKARLFDFMTLNEISSEKPDAKGVYPDYIDLVHFTPQVGEALASGMLGLRPLGPDLDLIDNPEADRLIDQLRDDDARWKSQKR